MEVNSMRRVTGEKSIYDISDKYTESIELSNACRHFYNSRMEAAASMKLKIQERITEKIEKPSSVKKRWGINEAMDKLREEMVSLMDQDLTLMKQLLNLNETIEDLKWQRSNYYSGSSSDESDFSVSETEMYADSSDNDMPHTRSGKFTTTTSPRRSQGNGSSSSCSSCETSLQQTGSNPRGVSRDRAQTVVMKTSVTNLNKSKIEYRSFDSGINESDHVEIRV